MRKIVVILPLLLILVLATLTVYADTSVKYSVNDWQIHAVINQDGSIDVKEYITYKVSPEHEGPVIRYIDISQASYVENLNVSGVIDVDPEEDITTAETEPYELVDKPEQNTGGTYALKPGVNADEIQEVHIYLPRDQQEETVVLSYKLNDFVFLYRDTAAVVWNPVINGYGNKIGNIDIRLSLSQKDGIDNIHPFVYGALNGNSQVLENGTINITGYKLQPEEFMEVVVLFPKSVVAEGRKLIDNDVVQKVLEEQQAKMEEMELLREKREQEQRFRTTITIIIAAGILGIGICGYLLYVRFNRSKSDEKKPDEQVDRKPMEHDVPEKGTGFRSILAKVMPKVPEKKGQEVLGDLPADYYTPAELSVLLRGKRIKPADIVATLLDLIVRRYVDIETVEKGNEAHYILRLKEYEPNSLKAHEEYLVNWFIKDIGDGNEVSTEAIKQSASASGAGDVFSTRLIIWRKLVLNQARRWKFWERGPFLWRSKRTEFGEKHYSEWMKFRMFLKGTNLEINSIPLEKWEKFLVYAFSLGLGENVVNALKTALAERSSGTADDGLTILHESNFHAIDEWFHLINSFSFARNITTRLVQSLSSIPRLAGRGRDRTM